MSSLNVNTRGHNQGGAGRFSPDPIDPIDIDYDPSASAHDLEIQVSRLLLYERFLFTI